MQEKEKTPKKIIVITVFTCVVIILLAAGIVWSIKNSEPTAQRETATKRSPMLVKTTTVSKGEYRPQINVLGQVDAAKEIILRPRVEGEIIKIGSHFEPGKIVEAGELLVQLDPSDYEIALSSRESELQQSMADLTLEKGRQKVAQSEYKRVVGKKLNPAQRALVLREPQLKNVEARIAGDKAAVDQAQLELSRTTIKAPFDAQIIERMANVGSQVNRGDSIAHLIGINEYWVIAKVPMSQLPWIQFGQEGLNQPKATIRKRGIWGEETVRHGIVQRFIGTLEEQTRLVRVLITVPDPLARQSEMPPLILDTIVQVIIEGRQLRDVVRLDRDYLRQGDTVWVKQNGKLSIRKVGVVMRDAEYAYINEGLEDGDAVVITNLSRIREGAELRIQGAAE